MKTLLRKIRLTLGKLILDKKIPGKLLPTNPKIIVLQQDGKIGDYIISSFIFRELKKYNPLTQVDVICSPKNENLFKTNHFIDHFFVLDKKAPCAYTKMGEKLAKENYDVLINLPVQLRNRDLWLTRLIKAKNNIGYQKQNYKLFNLDIPGGQLHFSQIYADSIKKCGVMNINSEYDIPDNSQQKEEIRNFIKDNQLENHIAINFFGAARSRKFTEKNIRKFIERFKVLNKKVLLLTYPEMTPLLKDIVVDFPNAFIYENTQDIFDTIELIRYADVVISPDTSIIHIASGLNKKLIGFYKLEDKENLIHWHPNSKNETHILSFIESVNEISPDDIQLEWITH